MILLLLIFLSEPFIDLEPLGFFGPSAQIHSHPSGIVITSQSDGLIAVLDEVGKLLHAFNERGPGPEEIQVPWCLGIRGDEIYFNDNGVIKVFSLDLKPKGTKGRLPTPGLRGAVPTGPNTWVGWECRQSVFCNLSNERGWSSKGLHQALKHDPYRKRLGFVLGDLAVMLPWTSYEGGPSLGYVFKSADLTIPVFTLEAVTPDLEAGLTRYFWRAAQYRGEIIVQWLDYREMTMVGNGFAYFDEKTGEFMRLETPERLSFYLMAVYGGEGAFLLDIDEMKLYRVE